MGNYDLWNNGELRTEGFDEARSLMLWRGDPPIVWTHYPLLEVPEGYVDVHGHIHQKPSKGRRINVSVEQLDYKPVEMTRLRKLAKALIRDGYPPGETTLERVNALG